MECTSSDWRLGMCSQQLDRVRRLRLIPCLPAPGALRLLQYIPGMTKSGVQKRPEWLDKLLGLEGEAQ